MKKTLEKREELKKRKGLLKRKEPNVTLYIRETRLSKKEHREDA